MRRAIAASLGAVTALLAVHAPGASAGQDPVLAIGDSVMLGAQRCLEDVDIDVDAAGNRRMSAGIDLLRRLGPKAPGRVVVHLGTNGGIRPGELDRLMQVLGTSRMVYLVTIALPDDPSRYSFEDRTNAAIIRMPHRYPNAYVLDWNGLVDQRSGLVGGDGIHLTNAGCTAYAQLVDDLARSPTG